jgi:hypothetical protein
MLDLDKAQSPGQFIEWWEGWAGQPFTAQQQDELLAEFERCPADVIRSIMRRWRHEPDRPDAAALVTLVREERLRRAPNVDPFREAAAAAEASLADVAKALDWRSDEELLRLRDEVMREHPSRGFMERSDPRKSQPLRALIYEYVRRGGNP